MSYCVNTLWFKNCRIIIGHRSIKKIYYFMSRFLLSRFCIYFSIFVEDCGYITLAVKIWPLSQSISEDYKTVVLYLNFFIFLKRIYRSHNRIVANSSPQTIFRACICSILQIFSPMYFFHTLCNCCNLLQIQLAALFRSLHSAYLLLGQLHVTTLRFLVFSLFTAFPLFTPQLIVGLSRYQCHLCDYYHYSAFCVIIINTP